MEKKLKNILKKETGNSGNVLIPVDFSAKSHLSIKVGFELGRRLNRNVTLLHASAVANPVMVPEFPDEFYGLDNENNEIEEMEMNEEIHDSDEKLFSELRRRLKRMQVSGELPLVNFKTVLMQGMPEEVISEYSESNSPEVIIMACRGKQRRHSDLIGSVTAEVIDNCVGTVLTVPEDYTFSGFKEIVRICAFCYFDDGDFECVSKLMKMFGSPEVKIFLFPANDKLKTEERAEALKNLQDKLSASYPKSDFIIGYSGEGKNLREEVGFLFSKENIQMILAPNRKRNLISRLFNPGLPHKILYEVDIPMLTLPV